MDILKSPMILFLFVIGAIIIGIAAVLFFSPIRTSTLRSHPHPHTTYQEAIDTFARLVAADEQGVDPSEKARLLTHGKKTKKVIVLFHGYTSAPRQFDALGKEFYERGYNVVIARLPQHGHTNRLGNALQYLTAEKPCVTADTYIDIAHGLGDEITVGGLSGGAIVAAWIGQERKDVEKVVLLAPSFGYILPPAFLRFMTNTLLYMPNQFLWWDNTQKEKLADGAWYTRFSTKGIGQIYLIGFAVREKSEREPSGAKTFIIVTVANDPIVNNTITQDLANHWRNKGDAVTFFEFPKTLDLDHNFIDPLHPKQNINAVYPVLLDLIDGKKAS